MQAMMHPDATKRLNPNHPNHHLCLQAAHSHICCCPHPFQMVLQRMEALLRLPRLLLHPMHACMNVQLRLRTRGEQMLQPHRQMLQPHRLIEAVKPITALSHTNHSSRCRSSAAPHPHRWTSSSGTRRWTWNSTLTRGPWVLMRLGAAQLRLARYTPALLC